MKTISQSLAAGNFEEAQRGIEAELLDHWDQPSLCHLGGIFYLWQANEEESKTPVDADKALSHWSAMIPLIVYAFENETYLEEFRIARESVYEQPIKRDDLQRAKKAAYSEIEAMIRKIADRYKELGLAEDLDRLTRVLDEWRLELESVSWIRKLGGIPNGKGEKNLVIAGPAYAGKFGFYQGAKNYIEEIPIKDSTIQSLLGMMFGQEREDEADIKRKASYCFSNLGLPFLFFRYKQLDRSLEFLNRLIDSEKDGAPADGDLVTKAVQQSHDARQLAMEIRVEVGKDSLYRTGTRSIETALSYWAEAIKDVDVLDSQTRNPLKRQGISIKARMNKIVRQRIQELLKGGDWDAGLVVAEQIARMIPEKDNLTQLVHILIQKGARSVNELDDYEDGIEHLERASMLAPENAHINQQLLVAVANYAQIQYQNGNKRAAADLAMDAISHSKEFLSRFPDDRDTQKIRTLMVQLLSMIFVEVREDDEFPADFKGMIGMVLQQSIGNGLGLGGEPSEEDREKVDENYRQIDCIRLFRRAAERGRRGEHEASYRDAERALALNPNESRIQELCEGAARHAISGLCEAGEIDRANDIAEKAYSRMPNSSEIMKLRTRVMILKLGKECLISEDPNVLTDGITVVADWLGQRAEDDELRTQGRKFRELINPDLKIARKLSVAMELFEQDEFKESLKLLESITCSDPGDCARRLYLMSLCLQYIGRVEEAMNLGKEMVAEYPNVALLRLRWAKMLSAAGRFKEAEDEFELYLDNFPGETDVLAELATNEMRAGRFQDAADDFRTTRLKGKLSIASIYAELVCLRHLGRPDEMKVVALACPQAHWEDEWDSCVLKWFIGEVPDEELERNATSDLRKSEMFYYLGEKKRAEGKIDEARALFERRLDLGFFPEVEFYHAYAILRGEIQQLA